MREFSIMTNLLREIESIARDRDATRVVGVTFRLGILTKISPAHLRDQFTHAAHNSIAEDAVLNIVEEKNTTSPMAREIRIERVDVA
jgi:hydrogenase nickel incorporation protein HypA/HybF